MTAGPDPTLSKAIFVPSVEVTVGIGFSYLQMVMSVTPEVKAASMRELMQASLRVFLLQGERSGNRPRLYVCARSNEATMTPFGVVFASHRVNAAGMLPSPNNRLS